ncbi:MAG: LysR family transcriptional regulator [Pseudomonadota bacterium]|nr:LysR family transcriptional regulator [Pseudomonadota bacterium]
MSISTEALLTFTHAAQLGSFSAAARRLGKQQSTISTSIANLEADLNLQLFDRSCHKPQLTAAGRLILVQAERVLAAEAALTETAQQLSAGLEPEFSLVLSDTYQSDHFETIMREFSERFGIVNFRCQIAEQAELVQLVQSGAAQLGLVATQNQYPADISAMTLQERSLIGCYAYHRHPLAQRAQQQRLTRQDLAEHRELQLSQPLHELPQVATRQQWQAPTYTMLLEMLMLGVGWASLPRWIVQRYAADQVVELEIDGWPVELSVDAIWSRQYPLGQAGRWLLEQMRAA